MKISYKNTYSNHVDTKSNRKISKESLLKRYNGIKSSSIELNKTIRMADSVSKKLKLVSGLSGYKQGQLIENLLDDYMLIFENEIKPIIKDIDSGKVRMVEV